MNVSLDVRYGLRKLNTNAGFTAVAVGCLALGICASVTVFSVVDALLLRPFPGVAEQDRIVSLGTRPFTMEGVPGLQASSPLSYRNFLRYREASRAFSELSAFFPVSMDLVAGGEPVRAGGQLVTDNYFPALGMGSAVGRLFAADGRGRAEPFQAVISHRLWQRVFSSRPQAVGRTLRLNSKSFVVVGVAPQGFHGTLHGLPADVWVPLEAAPLMVPWLRPGALQDPRSGLLSSFIGRLAPGMDLKRAQAEMDLLAARFAAGASGEERVSALQVYPGLGVWPGTRVNLISPLLLATAFVTLLMLVVCANLGGLLLVKAAARQEEIGVRLALGVTRSRLVRQLLTESLALSLLGGLAGFILALFVLDAFQGLSLGRFLPRIENLSIDARVAAFTLTLSLAAGTLFGLAPALWATRRQALPLLRPGGEGNTPDRGRTRLQEILVIGQVTVSLLLLVSTGLFVRTLQNLQSIDLGFDSVNVVDFRIDLSRHGYSETSGAAFHDQLLGRVRRVSGVTSASMTLSVPLSQDPGVGLISSLRPLTGPASQKPLSLEYNVVSPSHFRTLGIPLIQGRDFSVRDRKEGRRSVIVDEVLANTLWPRQNPIGEQVSFGPEKELREVVGVVRSIRVSDLQSNPMPYFYLPLAQSYQPALSLQVRTAGDPLRVVDPVRSILHELDPEVAFDARLFQDEVEETLAQPRLFSWLFGTFSLVALLITAIGLYGTLAYSVSRRTRELGIRMAMGARTSEIMVLVIRRGLSLTVAGLALGVLAGIWTTSIFSGFLFGVTSTDPGVFGSVVLLLMLVGLAASSLPAYSATRVDPMAVIRHE